MESRIAKLSTEDSQSEDDSKAKASEIELECVCVLDRFRFNVVISEVATNLFVRIFAGKQYERIK